jgi:hypothetical protein
MPTIVLAADALGVLHVITVQITGYDVATTYKLTRNGKVVSVLGSGGTASTTATALKNALAASTIPEFAEMTWTVNTDTVTGTANESTLVGKTHIFTSSVSGGGGAIGAVTTSTTPKGINGLTAENVISTAGSRALPTNSDTFVLQQVDEDLLYGLDALSAVTGLTLDVKASFTGELGLPVRNEDNTEYLEDRQRYLQTSGGTITIGAGGGDGSGRLQIDSGSALTTIVVILTDRSTDDNQHAFVWKGTHASNTLKAESGTIDVAPYAGETATILTLTATGDAEVRTSRGTTLGTVYVDQASEVTIDSAASLADITAIYVRGTGTLNLIGDNAITALHVDGTAPTVNFQASADFTITTLNAYEGAILDLSNCPNTVTITTFNALGRCTIRDPNGKLVITNAIARFASLITWQGTPARAFTLGAP